MLMLILWQSVDDDGSKKGTRKKNQRNKTFVNFECKEFMEVKGFPAGSLKNETRKSRGIYVREF